MQAHLHNYFRLPPRLRQTYKFQPISRVGTITKANIIIVILIIEEGITTVLVENFPRWQWWQKAWFKSHQRELQERFGIPVGNKDGSWSIFFMGWQDGYRKDSLYDQDSDLLCFDDMNTDVNCIRKEPLLWVSKNAYGVVNYR